MFLPTKYPVVQVFRDFLKKNEKADYKTMRLVKKRLRDERGFRRN